MRVKNNLLTLKRHRCYFGGVENQSRKDRRYDPFLFYRKIILRFGSRLR
jgi:hypothetical protein